MGAIRPVFGVCAEDHERGKEQERPKRKVRRETDDEQDDVREGARLNEP